MAAVAARYNEFTELDAEVLAISVDSQFVHKMWNDVELAKMVDGGIPYPMLSDQSGAVGTEYGVYDEGNSIEMRGLFLIDPDGVVQGYEVLSPPVGRNVSEFLRQIKAFQHVRATEGTEATPTGWEPGKKVLKPGEDLVGKVWEEWKTDDK